MAAQRQLVAGTTPADDFSQLLRGVCFSFDQTSSFAMLFKYL